MDLVSFDKDYITFQLNFEEPLFVSQGEFKDQLVIELDKSYFLIPSHLSEAQADTLPSGQTVTLSKVVPRQVKSQEEAETLENIGSNSKALVFASFAIPLLAQLGLRGVMSKMWIWVNMM